MKFLSLFRGRIRRLRFVCVGVVTACVLAGCSDDPGLQERVNRLQAELQEKGRQLQEAQAALEKTRSELKSARAANASRAPDTNAPTPTGSP